MTSEEFVSSQGRHGRKVRRGSKEDTKVSGSSKKNDKDERIGRQEHSSSAEPSQSRSHGRRARSSSRPRRAHSVSARHKGSGSHKKGNSSSHRSKSASRRRPRTRRDEKAQDTGSDPTAEDTTNQMKNPGYQVLLDSDCEHSEKCDNSNNNIINNNNSNNVDERNGERADEPVVDSEAPKVRRRMPRRTASDVEISRRSLFVRQRSERRLVRHGSTSKPRENVSTLSPCGQRSRSPSGHRTRRTELEAPNGPRSLRLDPSSLNSSHHGSHHNSSSHHRRSNNNDSQGNEERRAKRSSSGGQSSQQQSSTHSSHRPLNGRMNSSGHQVNVCEGSSTNISVEQDDNISSGDSVGKEDEFGGDDVDTSLQSNPIVQKWLEGLTAKQDEILSIAKHNARQDQGDNPAGGLEGSERDDDPMHHDVEGMKASGKNNWSMAISGLSRKVGKGTVNAVRDPTLAAKRAVKGGVSAVSATTRYVIRKEKKKRNEEYRSYNPEALPERQQASLCDRISRLVDATEEEDVEIPSETTIQDLITQGKSGSSILPSLPKVSVTGNGAGWDI